MVLELKLVIVLKSLAGNVWLTYRTPSVHADGGPTVAMRRERGGNSGKFLPPGCRRWSVGGMPPASRSKRIEILPAADHRWSDDGKWVVLLCYFTDHATKSGGVTHGFLIRFFYCFIHFCHFANFGRGSLPPPPPLPLATSLLPI